MADTAWVYEGRAAVDAGRLTWVGKVAVWFSGAPWLLRWAVLLTATEPLLAAQWGHRSGLVGVSLSAAVLTGVSASNRFGWRGSSGLSRAEAPAAMRAFLTGRSSGAAKIDGWAAHRAAQQIVHPRADRLLPIILGLVLVAAPVIAAARTTWWWLACLVAACILVPAYSARPKAGALQVMDALHPPELNMDEPAPTD